RSGRSPAPPRQDLRCGMAASGRSSRAGSQAARAVPRRHPPSHRLLGMPPMRPPPALVAKHCSGTAPDLDRRSALKLLASGTALALASCGRPHEEVVPYVQMPERLTPGVPLRFATALPLGGLARGVIVTSMEGRPIKVHGNPRHPASLGATDV